MANVIGSYFEGTGGGEVTIPLLDVSGSWPAGTVPGTWTITVPGPDLFALGGAGVNQLLSPHTHKTILGGDFRHTTEVRYLYVDESTPNEWRENKAQITITLNDRRVWWHRRPPMGARMYNCDQFGERLSPFRQVTPTPAHGSNPRYDPHSMRTGEQILREIFAFLGEQQTDIKINGERGWADLRAIEVVPGVSILQDTPEFVLPDGASPVEAMDLFCRIYDLMVWISPDLPDVGFIRTSDIPNKLTDTAAEVQALATDPIRDFVPAASIGRSRESLPEVLYLHGAPIVLGDFLHVRQVARDPDRPERFIPLWLKSTLEAYGVDLSLPGRKHITDGEACIRLATGLAGMSDIAPEIPPRLHSLVHEWGRLWQVAMPLELVQISAEGVETVGGGLPREQVVETAGNSEFKRIKSPIYRFIRDNSKAAGAFSTGGTFPQWEPTESSTDAEPHRWLPLLAHTADKLSDGSFGKLKLYGVNAVRFSLIRGSQGNDSFDYVDLGEPRLLDGVESVPIDTPYLGIEPVLVDAEQGVIDTGEPVWGSDGRFRTYEQEIANPDGTTRTRTYKASILVADLAQPSMTMADLWLREEQSSIRSDASAISVPGEPDVRDAVEKAPIGSPMLFLYCAFFKKSHGDARDSTSTHSTVPVGRGSDPALSSLIVLGGLTYNIYSQVDLPTLTQDPSQQVAHPLDVYSYGMPDLQLRCLTARVLSVYLSGQLQPLSFLRDGGWNSGQLGGTCSYQDAFLADATTAMSYSGFFAPFHHHHYLEVFNTITDAIKRVDGALKEFRRTEDNIKTVTAELKGWHRWFFPGSVEFARHPVDSIYVHGSGDNAEAGMRITANSRGWQPYVGSALERLSTSLTGHRAATSSISGVMQGGVA